MRGPKHVFFKVSSFNSEGQLLMEEGELTLARLS